WILSQTLLLMKVLSSMLLWKSQTEKAKNLLFAGSDLASIMTISWKRSSQTYLRKNCHLSALVEAAFAMTLCRKRLKFTDIRRRMARPITNWQWKSCVNVFLVTAFRSGRVNIT
ncbi:hypothetical protein M514_08126, partial [Trichuris suis]